MAPISFIYDDAVKKGGGLLDNIHQNPSASTSSAFDNSTDMSSFGWHKTHSFTQIQENPADPIRKMIEHLKIKSDAAGNPRIRLRHEHDTTIHSQLYPATRGFYEHTYNVESGSIFVHAMESPMKGGKDMIPPITDIVPLNHWSDLTYLQWQQLAIDRHELNRVVHINITNMISRIVIKEVLGRAGIKVETLAYPGAEFVEDDDDFKALLGTPNGSGTAFMLAQRKSENGLGWKVVEKISVFRSDSGKRNVPESEIQVSMILHIGRHPG